MSYLEKLLAGAEVEWRPLGEVATLRRGRVMSKGYLTDNEGDYPVYSSQTANQGMIGKIDTFDFDGEFISWTTDGANAGTVFYRTGKFSITNVCGLIKINDQTNLNYKFLFYWLSTQAQKHVYSGMGNPKLMSHQIEKVLIPIPCPENPEKSLAIQEEIARVLDAFTALTAELTAELTMRKKQYNYYRNLLLSFEEGKVEWKPLEEIANIKNGKDWKTLGVGDVPVYGSGGVMQYVDTFAYDKPTVLIPRKGSITNIFYVDSPFWNVDTIYYTEIDTDQIIPKFFYYFVKTIDLMQLDTGSGRPSLTQAILNKIKIPLPKLDAQARIVAILDKFDALTSSLQEGLPREIELRQKQYAYYRDLLLNFPKPKETAI